MPTPKASDYATLDNEDLRRLKRETLSALETDHARLSIRADAGVEPSATTGRLAEMKAGIDKLRAELGDAATDDKPGS